MSDVSSVNNLLIRGDEEYAATLSAGIVSGATTIAVNVTVSGDYVDGDAAALTVEPGTANQATFTGVKSGTSWINCVWTEGNTGIGHSSGATVIDYDSATHQAALVKWALVQHNQSGTHKAITAPSITTTGNATIGGTLAVTAGTTLPAGDIGAADLANNAVIGPKLATDSILLGFASIDTQFVTTSNSYVQVTGLSVTVTVPTGGRKLVVKGKGRHMFNANAGGNNVQNSLWDGAVGTGTLIAENLGFSSQQDAPANAYIETQPLTVAPGSKTYNMGFSGSNVSNKALSATPTSPAWIAVYLV